MFYSKRLRLLFVACPKTGSTSVEKFLQELDPDGDRFAIRLPNQTTIISRDVRSASLGHATAREFNEVLGDDRYDALFVFGFVRDPIEKLVSSYFFIRQYPLANVWATKNRRQLALQLFNTAIARSVPFPVWALVFPMKDGARYFLDDDDRICVNGIGCIERLSDDLDALLQEADVETDGRSVGHVNRSRHAEAATYIKPDSLLDRVLRRRYAKDLALYALVADGPAVGCQGQRLQVPDAARRRWPFGALGWGARAGR